MTSKRKLAAYTPDGTEVTWASSAQYDIAGLIKLQSGHWYKAEHGFSTDSVLKRTRRTHNIHPSSVGYAAVPIWEQTAPVVRRYFGTHAVVIDSYFLPGQGDVYTGGEIGKGRMKASRAIIRRLLAEGATQISFRSAGSWQIADFQAAELQHSLRETAPRASAAAMRKGH